MSSTQYLVESIKILNDNLDSEVKWDQNRYPGQVTNEPVENLSPALMRQIPTSLLEAVDGTKLSQDGTNWALFELKIRNKRNELDLLIKKQQEIYDKFNHDDYINAQPLSTKPSFRFGQPEGTPLAHSTKPSFRFGQPKKKHKKRKRKCDKNEMKSVKRKLKF
jgi:hypothetical protein